MGRGHLPEGPAGARVLGSRPRLPGSGPRLGVGAGDGQIGRQRRTGTWPETQAASPAPSAPTLGSGGQGASAVGLRGA